mmetsp:Transcript_18640/g.37984  ORF Transcript_18640/g.37984 Transcript_18640/m.37984 type:complete len:146 (-) Transcript_18640:145-582(-)
MGRRNALSELQKQVADGIATSLLVYGVTIAAFGAIGAGLHSFEKKAMHSLYAGLGCLLFMSSCAGLLKFSNHRTIATVVGITSIVAECVFLLVFSIQAARSRSDPAKRDRFLLFVAMAMTTVTGLLMVFKPFIPLMRRERKARKS